MIANSYCRPLIAGKYVILAKVRFVMKMPAELSFGVNLELNGRMDEMGQFQVPIQTPAVMVVIPAIAVNILMANCKKHQFRRKRGFQSTCDDRGWKVDRTRFQKSSRLGLPSME